MAPQEDLPLQLFIHGTLYEESGSSLSTLGLLCEFNLLIFSLLRSSVFMSLRICRIWEDGPAFLFGIFVSDPASSVPFRC